MAPGEIEALEVAPEPVPTGVEEVEAGWVEGVVAVETVSLVVTKSSLLQLIWIMGAITGSLDSVVVDVDEVLVIA